MSFHPDKTVTYYSGVRKLARWSEDLGGYEIDGAGPFSSEDLADIDHGRRVIRLTVIRNDRDDLIVSGWYARSNTSIAPCACVAQAYYHAVKGRPQPGDLVDLRDHKGRLVASIPACRVPKDGVEWAGHGHTHIPFEFRQLPPRPNEYCCLDHALCNTDSDIPGHEAARAAAEYFIPLVDDGLVDRFCGQQIGPGGCEVILDD